MSLIDVDQLAAPAFSVVPLSDGYFQYDGLNAAISAIGGLSKASRIGFTPHQCMPLEMADRLTTQYRRSFDSRAMHEYEAELDLPNGHKWWRTTLSPVLGSRGHVVQILGLVVDITERKHAEIELRSAAFKDPLTGICNRRRFDRDLEIAVARANDKDRPFSLILADVDRFKSINDTHGHGAGDAVLIALAQRLTSGIRDNDRLARIGGDEFAAILTAGSEGSVAVAVDRMHRQLAGPIRVGGLDLIVGVSLGATLWRRGMTTTDMLAAADAAMYQEKGVRAA